MQRLPAFDEMYRALVERDALGVPHIKAASVADALFAQIKRDVPPENAIKSARLSVDDIIIAEPWSADSKIQSLAAGTRE